jgi:zinc protease
MKVLLFPDPTKSTITVAVTYMVGSRHEGYGETGMAHLLEHMLFKGSTNHPNIPKELSDHGSRPNGSTSFDRTNYYETFQATDENLNWALSLEADRMVNSFVARKDLDSEMTVVRNEYESSENNPQGVLFKRVLAAMYDWHNYGNVPIGARTDIERVPIENLQAFYRHFYQPDNALLVVAGKIDEPKTLELVNKYFAPIPRPTRTLRTTHTAEPAQDGERTVTLRRVGESQALVVGWHIPPGSHEEFAPLAMAAQMLGDVPAGRLHKALVETKKAALASMGAQQLRDPGFAMLQAQAPKDKALEEIRQIALQTVDEALTTKKFTQEELDRVKLQTQKGFDLFMNNSESVALSLSSWQGMGDWRLMFLYRDRVKQVTLEQAQKAAEKYLISSNRTVGLYMPEAKEPVRAAVPEAPDVDSLVKDYKGTQIISQGEAFDPSTSNIDKRTIRGDLKGGLKLSFIEKKTRGNQVNALITLRLGDENSLKGRDTAGQLAGQMLMRGTARHTRQQLKDELTRLKANAQVFGGATSIGANVTTTRENLKPVLDLVAEMLMDSTFPADEFEQLRQQQITGLESQKSEPQVVAAIALQRHLSPYPKDDVRYVDSIDERIANTKAVTLDEVKAFAKDFYGASSGEIAIVGDFDPESAQTQLAALFNNWKSPKKYARIQRPFQNITPKSEAFQTPDKANAMWLAAIPVRMKDSDTDYPALFFGNYILGQMPLNNRLFARIRGKEGLSYGVGARFQAGAEDESAVFVANAICAPQNAPKVEASFKDELQKILNEGYTTEEVEAAKKAWVQSQTMTRGQDQALVSMLNGYRYLGRTMEWQKQLEEKVLALTPAQIQAAMKKHLDLSKANFFRAGDFAKAQVNF